MMAPMIKLLALALSFVFAAASVVSAEEARIVGTASIIDGDTIDVGPEAPDRPFLFDHRFYSQTSSGGLDLPSNACSAASRMAM